MSCRCPVNVLLMSCRALFCFVLLYCVHSMSCRYCVLYFIPCPVVSCHVLSEILHPVLSSPPLSCLFCSPCTNWIIITREILSTYNPITAFSCPVSPLCLFCLLCLYSTCPCSVTIRPLLPCSIGILSWYWACSVLPCPLWFVLSCLLVSCDLPTLCRHFSSVLFCSGQYSQKFGAKLQLIARFLCQNS